VPCPATEMCFPRTVQVGPGLLPTPRIPRRAHIGHKFTLMGRKFTLLDRKYTIIRSTCHKHRWRSVTFRGEIDSEVYLLRLGRMYNSLGLLKPQTLSAF
jgi:hypothetical protein